MSAAATMTSTGNLFMKAKMSGRCPPSLLSESNFPSNDTFGTLVANITDNTVEGFCLLNDLQATHELAKALKVR
jgi:hypothetical protein